jgi:hypothetical protein
MRRRSVAPVCVYAHYFMGEVYYVGCGRAIRPFEFSNRSWNWFGIFRPDFPVMPRWIDVRILSWHASRGDGLRREAELIRKWRPLCNVAAKTRGPERVSARRTMSSIVRKRANGSH